MRLKRVTFDDCSAFHQNNSCAMTISALTHGLSDVYLGIQQKQRNTYFSNKNGTSLLPCKFYFHDLVSINTFSSMQINCIENMKSKTVW